MTQTEPVSAALRQSAQQAFDFAQGQVRRLITNHPDYFPLFTVMLLDRSKNVIIREEVVSIRGVAADHLFQ